MILGSWQVADFSHGGGAVGAECGAQKPTSQQDDEKTFKTMMEGRGTAAWGHGNAWGPTTLRNLKLRGTPS